MKIITYLDGPGGGDDKGPTILFLGAQKKLISGWQNSK